ncbi:MAG: branched-chain amino acid transport system II carrier protein [Simkaniaceae bacterium]
MIQNKTIFHGFALFSMLFGAGNVIFPLIIGQVTGHQVGSACLGLILTAVLIPFVGLYSMMLYEGDQFSYFERVGKTPAFILMTLLLSLLGPLGAIPRCITLSHATFKTLLPNTPLFVFSLLSSAFIFYLLTKKVNLLDLLGMILTPLLLLSIGLLIFKGSHGDSAVILTQFTKKASFSYGLKEGYQTMDLLAAFFFSTLICQKMKKEKSSPLYAIIIGAGLLALVYVAFAFIASSHSAELRNVPSEELFNALGYILLGEKASILISLIVGLSCLTTALALSSICADFLKNELFSGKIHTSHALILTLVLSSLVSTLHFSGITIFLSPVLKVCYPALLTLAFLNILYKRQGFKPIKTPIYLSLSIGFLFTLI